MKFKKNTRMKSLVRENYKQFHKRKYNSTKKKKMEGSFKVQAI